MKTNECLEEKDILWFIMPFYACSYYFPFPAIQAMLSGNIQQF